MSACGWLIDTNILIRLSVIEDPLRALVQTALDDLTRREASLHFCMQNIAEFWNVCTRPFDRNGYGLSLTEVNRRLENIELAMTLLSDTSHVYSQWRNLVVHHRIRGVQVHEPAW